MSKKYSLQQAKGADIEDLLNNIHEEELEIHKKYAPWVSFKSSVRGSVDHPETKVVQKSDGEILAIWGINQVQDCNVMWCIPRKGMAFKDRVATLKLGKRYVADMYEKHGTLYAPVHAEWPEVKDLVLFLGFSILGEGNIAVYGDAENEY